MVSPQRRMAIEREAERGGDARLAQQVFDPPSLYCRRKEADDDEVYCALPCPNDQPEQMRYESGVYNVANR